MKGILVILSGISIFTILIIKYLWANEPEFWMYGEETGDVLFDLSVGYISAYIFYIIDIWIPGRKEQERINQRVAIPLSRLLNQIKSPIVEVNKLYSNDSFQFENISENEFKKTLRKLDLVNDKGFIMAFPSNNYLNVGQSLYENVSKVDSYIKQINEMPVKLEFGLVEILDKIKHSDYHEVMNSISNLTNFSGYMSVNGEAIEGSMYKYYLLFFELKEYMKTNKIPITISDL
ncbi:hypothetical protein [Bacillus sp. ISL-45]|uniref:hypothetical protein n=1 Tax=Bacillus sp. ISL-45 TaxID=2819128 RepID=UPI001BEB4AF5|nr:hypothetical protein [Bacillus sp. ISL-45]MBT2661932.1 hypothetical protein [Bacillus sp. ISL-45]